MKIISQIASFISSHTSTEGSGPAQHVQHTKNQDFPIFRREPEKYPELTLWNKFEDWFYFPNEFEFNGKEFHIRNVEFIVMTGLALCYLGLALYLKRSPQ